MKEVPVTTLALAPEQAAASAWSVRDVYLQHGDFIWRCLQRLGIWEVDLDDWEKAFDWAQTHRWHDYGIWLRNKPGLVVARRGARHVKFAIRDWTLSDGVSVDG